MKRLREKTMPRKNSRNTKGKIIKAAWKLFYEQGYEETTIEDIIFESHTSRGSFYHYFKGKDALLGTLADLFDEEYSRLSGELHDDMPLLDKLLYLNHALFSMIETSVSRDLLARLLSTQLLASGEKHLLDRNRTYFRLLRKICDQGIADKSVKSNLSSGEIIKAYALWERALLYDWCLCEGDYSLKVYSDMVTPRFLHSLLF